MRAFRISLLGSLFSPLVGAGLQSGQIRVRIRVKVKLNIELRVRVRIRCFVVIGRHKLGSGVGGSGRLMRAEARRRFLPTMVSTRVSTRIGVLNMAYRWARVISQRLGVVSARLAVGARVDHALYPYMVI